MAFLNFPVSSKGFFGPAMDAFTVRFTEAQKSQALRHFLPKRSSSASISSRPKTAPTAACQAGAASALAKARAWAWIASECSLTIQRAAASFKMGTSCPLKAFQRMLRLMAAASAVIPMSLLHMGHLQYWLKTAFRSTPEPRLCQDNPSLSQSRGSMAPPFNQAYSWERPPEGRWSGKMLQLRLGRSV